MRLPLVLVLLASACAHDPALDAIQASCAQAATSNSEMRAHLDGLRTDYAKLRADYDKLMAMIEGPARAAEPAPEEPPQRVEVPTEGAASVGPADAKVVIVEFSDFECPFCSRVQPTIAQIRETWPNDVRLVFRHLPLPFHEHAMLAAKAAEAAGLQGKFWPMHDLMFESQQLDRASLEGYAKKLQLNMKRFKRDLDDPAVAARVEADAKLADQVGARGTPAFFINGWLLSGAQPFHAFKEKIEAELAVAAKP